MNYFSSDLGICEEEFKKKNKRIEELEVKRLKTRNSELER